MIEEYNQGILSCVYFVAEFVNPQGLKYPLKVSDTEELSNALWISITNTLKIGERRFRSGRKHVLQKAYNYLYAKGSSILDSPRIQSQPIQIPQPQPSVLGTMASIFRNMAVREPLLQPKSLYPQPKQSNKYIQPISVGQHRLL